MRQVFEGCVPNFSLRGIHVVNHPDGRVVMFEIPAAPQGMPIAWKGFHYARAGESLVPMPTEKIDAIRNQESLLDWTARVIEDAEISDLSEEALSIAREAFMNHSQAKRYLPLPEYDLSDPGEVKLTIWGSVVDEAYTNLLMSRSDLPFDEVMALDRVQKGRPVSDEMLRRLRKKKLVEGRRPRLRVSASVAEATGTKVDYLEQRGQSREYLCAVVTDLLAKSGPCSRAEIDDALRPHLPADLDAPQRRNKVDHLLRSMRREARIRSVRIDGKRMWVLA